MKKGLTLSVSGKGNPFLRFPGKTKVSLMKEHL